MPPLFKQGESIIVEFGVGAPQLGKIIAVSQGCEMITVRLGDGVMGKGDMPLQWRNHDEYELSAGGTVKVHKLT
jgi:hypothetical protein